MNQENPYASPRTHGPLKGPTTPDDAPQVELVVEVNPWPWRWLDYVLLPSECALPELCVRCGAPSDRPLRPERVSWVNPVNVVLFGLAAMVRRRQGLVFFTLCQQHDRRSNLRPWAGWGLGAAAVIQFLLGFYLASTLRAAWPFLLMLSAFFTLLLAVAILTVKRGELKVQRIENNVVWLRDLPPKFYADLPQLRSLDGRNPIIPHFQLTES